MSEQTTLSAKQNYEILKRAAAAFEAKKQGNYRELARQIIKDSRRNYRRSQFK